MLFMNFSGVMFTLVSSALTGLLLSFLRGLTRAILLHSNSLFYIESDETGLH